MARGVRMGWLIVVCLAAGADAQAPEPEPAGPTINDITFMSGSPLGSQRLAVTGSGFTTNFHDGHNTIDIGSNSKGWASCAVSSPQATCHCL